MIRPTQLPAASPVQLAVSSPVAPFSIESGLGLTVRLPASPARIIASTEAAVAAPPGLANRLVVTFQSPATGSGMETASLAAGVAPG
ncbi:hypothetical protein D9M72_504110 [compost metagenome]